MKPPAPDQPPGDDDDLETDLAVDTDVDTDTDDILPHHRARAPSTIEGPVQLEAPYGGGRLDAFLADAPALQGTGLSRSRLKSLVEQGQVTVDGAVVGRGSLKLRGGQRVVVTVPSPQAVELVAEDLPLSLVYDDDDLCVVDKPAGFVVHPGAGHLQGTVANALLFRFPTLSISGERRPGIVHRLDKDTSGLLLVAKNDVTLQALQAQFIARTVDKRYVGLCYGAPGEVGGVVELKTGHRRADGDRRRFTTKVPAPPPGASAPGGVRFAHTAVTTRAVRDQVAVVDVTLFTGRTHQIRAHLADRGHALLQDALYGGDGVERRLPSGAVRDAVAGLRRQALHAASLAFTHPRTGLRMALTSPLPSDLQRILDAVLKEPAS